MLPRRDMGHSTSVSIGLHPEIYFVVWNFLFSTHLLGLLHGSIMHVPILYSQAALMHTEQLAM